MIRFASIAMCLTALAGCARQEPTETARTDTRPFAEAETQPFAAHKIDAKHLPNPVQVTEHVISGGLPEGEAAFAELEALGVKTVISVDGAKPDVDLAARHGMRYVHLPHGYDGVPDERALALSKAVRDLDGPIYIHCHHGKHRSPAAAAVACVGAGLIPPASALAILELAGTSPNYRGLYQSAREMKRIDDRTLAGSNVDFPAIAKLPALAEAMVAVEHTHDHLKALAANGWQPLVKQPDLHAAHEALLLREHFQELLRLEEVDQWPTGFKELLQAGHTAAMQLEASLEGTSAANASSKQHENAAEALALVNANCTSCHQKYRDVPLGEKHAR